MLNLSRDEGSVKDLYDYEIYDFDKQKSLEIIYLGNLDLYWIFTNMKKITEGEPTSVVDDFIINKESDPKLYNLFDKLYKEIAESDFYNYNGHKNKNLNFFNKENKVIRYISDEKTISNSDEVKIYQEEERYRLEFIKKDKSLSYHTIRFSTSGCRYGDLYIPFLNTFNRLDGVFEHYDEPVKENKNKVLTKKNNML